MAAANDRVTELEGLVKKYKDAYYNGQPLVSDAAYDELEDELRRLAPDSAALKSIGAPAPAGGEWPKARHAIPMGSLNKAVNEAELRQWAERCDKLGAEAGLAPITTSLLVTEKLDGLSLAVNYVDGRIAEAITRGDGHVGENITPNARRMQGVPSRLPEKLTVSIRGEIILKLSDVKRGFPGYVATPRNKAAGTSKRFDGEGCQYLTVMFYDLEGGPKEYATEEEKYEALSALGLIVPWFTVTDLEGALRVHQDYVASKRGALDYEIDGLVVRANDLRSQHLLGELGDRPRAAVAFKFPSLAKNSKVVAITWETGPSGRVTPIAQVEPVDIGGAIVQNVSLHNTSNVERLGVGVGDEVLVSRRNDVIPYLEEVVVKHGTVATPPEACVSCKQPLTRRGEYLQCTNKECFAIVTGRLRRWVGVQDILEWGEKLIVQLVEAGLVKEPADLYRLTVEQIAGLERRGELSAKKIVANLHARLPLTLPVFLASLGMEDFAFETAKLLVANGYDTLEKLFEAKEEEIAGLKGMGEIKAKSVVAGLAARRDEIGRLRAAGIEPVPPKTGGGLYGRSFCFTGTLPRPRKEYEELVEKHGGTLLAGVTKDLDFLVLADPGSGSTKAEKAKKYGTACIDADQFMALVARAEAGEHIESPRAAAAAAAAAEPAEPKPKKARAKKKTVSAPEEEP
ncbi:MAG: NAD-dependent DNA ligase LigA [Labilithrix sp.]|nr:NAD-dependent DNA ligase LigA [Labilithrix sp.]MCW5809701.1 NAD-dependent DNA ligase LigA [Labilithrix sp.]